MARIPTTAEDRPPRQPGKRKAETADGRGNPAQNGPPLSAECGVPESTPAIAPTDGAPRAAPAGNGATVSGGDPRPLSDEKKAKVGPNATFEPENIEVKVILVCGDLTKVEVPVAVAGRYDGLALAGPTKAFDRLLDSWLTRALDLRIIGSGLGQLFPINLRHAHEAGKVKAANLLLAGMGEPGRFAGDDLRFLMCNVTIAVKAMGFDEFAIGLIGTRRKELGIADAVRSFLQGIVDGYERLCAIAGAVRESSNKLLEAAKRPLTVHLVDPDENAVKRIHAVLDELRNNRTLERLKLDVDRGPDANPDEGKDKKDKNKDSDSGPTDGGEEAGSEVSVTLLRVRRAETKPNADAAGATPSADRAEIEPYVFQFSALSEFAAAPMREEDINPYFVRELPNRLINTTSARDRERFGTFFANCMIPEDFQKLTDGTANVHFEVDESTALYPWEMLAYNKYSRTSFLSTSVAVSRQFSSQLAPAPSSPPPLNTSLKVLIIADPAPGRLRLPNARAEGQTIVEMIDRARIAWRGQYEMTAVLRIGSSREPDEVDRILKYLRERYNWLDVDLCDPLELATLIVNDQYDLIHYAGHGLSDPKTGFSGWVFADDCYLSAKEIFRVRQVPRLVFANACFSAVTNDHREQREHLVGLAKAFFARGIPNFIGTGWQVDDACALECARWFYSSIFGLAGPDSGAVIGQAPATIGESLCRARAAVLGRNSVSSSWGAYQHYGHVGDRLLPRVNGSSEDAGESREAAGTTTPPASFAAAAASADAQTPAPPAAGEPRSDVRPDLLYVNGIDIETGQYAFRPRSIDDVAKQVLAHPGVGAFAELHAEAPRSFALPFRMDPNKLNEAGWGIIFHEDTPQDVRTALDPLIAARRTQAGDRLKVLDYKKGEQLRDWYQRHRVSAGNIDPEIVPYYLLLVGTPDLIPFDFQYLLDVEYAVGRLAFASAAEYEQYARSVIDYEGAKTAANRKEISYWGTRHQGDPATNLSAALLIDPLANGIAGAAGSLKRPIHAEVGYQRSLSLGDDATKAKFLATLHAERAPALLFTASHGMAVRSGRQDQRAVQGALLCQDWPSFGNIRPEHLLTAADVDDDANVKGVVALVFACFGAGTPDLDQFPMDLSQAGQMPALAPQPFIAALPNRLLAHPKGGALAVIGHVDRAWGFSIQTPKVPDAQIGTFRNSLGYMLSGTPVGHAISSQFGGRFAALATSLGSATSPTAPASMRPTDRDLVACWLERNDAQNYILLGDPAVRIREDLQA
jgi:hypothetical protein